MSEALITRGLQPNLNKHLNGKNLLVAIFGFVDKFIQIFNIFIFLSIFNVQMYINYILFIHSLSLKPEANLQQTIIMTLITTRKHLYDAEGRI